MVQATPGTVSGTLGCTIILGIKLSGVVLQTKPQTGMKCYGDSKSLELSSNASPWPLTLVTEPCPLIVSSALSHQKSHLQLFV